LNINFTHKDEVTPECAKACALLADAGLPLGGQTVLLKGVNDSAIVLQELFNTLLKIRVRPYYVFQMDRIKGGAHFRCELDTMVNIMKELIGFNSGLAIPDFIVDTNELGKTPLRLDYVVRGADGKYTLNNFVNKKSMIY
jgi:lysine 2,3-aminomutase